MKYLTTRKAIKENCNNVKCAGYCEMANLLRGIEPNAYTRGIYGWNFDIYEFDELTITTGYRNMIGGHVIKSEYYENKAKEIWDNYTLPYDEREKEVKELLTSFIKVNGGFGI